MVKDINVTDNGNSLLVNRKEQIRQQVRLVVLTTCENGEVGSYGERYGFPEYGCSAIFSIFNHFSEDDLAKLKNAIYDALKHISTIEVFFNDIDISINEILQQAEIIIYFKDLLTEEKQNLKVVL